MNNKSILFGIAGLIVGALLTWTITANQPNSSAPMESSTMSHGQSMTMDDMMTSLNGKTGDDFDKAFISGMIEHHQGAINMAQAAKVNAKHDEIKKMADEIISAQTSEINQMKQWQQQWGY
jgi:uncharacterized protein (DUF305 family)